jgi:dipeptidyl aminopeptidase/acylaminoacyl peptidase
MYSRYSRLILGVALTCGGVPLLRADDSDLSRLTPVPAGQEIPVADFLRPALIENPKLNPSGSFLAADVTVGNDRHRLGVFDLKNKTQKVVGGWGDSDVYDIEWLNDKRLVFQVSVQKLFGIGIFAANVNDVAGAYPLVQFYGSSIISVPADDRLRPIVWNSFDQLELARDLGAASLDSGMPNGRAVNVAELQSGGLEGLSAMRDAQKNNERHLVDRYPKPPGTVTGYEPDKNGHLAFAFAYDHKGNNVYRLVDGAWVKCPVDYSRWDSFGPGNKPGELVARETTYNEAPHPLVFLETDTGKAGDVLLRSKDYDFTGWVYRDPVSHDVIGAGSELDGPHFVWFNDTYDHLQTLLNGLFPGVVVQVLGSNDAQNFFLVETSSDRQPPIYHWVDLETKATGIVKHSMPWIDPARMRPMGVVHFKTRDGHSLVAYLTLPKGASRTHPVPLVVLSHGGPWLRDSWGYNGEVQLLANRGYAVLQTNYRGSTGTEWSFPARHKWNFLEMHYDVADATRAVVAGGLVDPDRIAIMGGSFGAYLALEGVVDDPALYRCAVGISGVYDWGDFMNEKRVNLERFGDLSFSTMMAREGDPADHKEMYDAMSPARHIDRVRVPIFVSHGGYDEIADIGQARKLEHELDRYHVPYESNIVSSETHGMQHLSNNVVLYTKILEFLAKNLAPRTPPPAVP